MSHLTKYEKETILLTSEGGDYWDVYTFNPALKKKLVKYAEKHPALCHLIRSTEEGSVTYRIDKRRLSIRLTEPYSDERRQAASNCARERGINGRK